MDGAKTYDELLDEMYGNREALVKALHFFNGEANTKELRKRGGIPRGSMYELVCRMEDWDVIEQVGKEPVGRGGQADVFQFTDLGRAICEAIVSDDSMTVDEVKDLSKQVEHLSEMVESISENINTHREIIKDHEEDLDELDDDYEEIKEEIDGPLKTVATFLEQQEDSAVQS